MFQRVIDFDAEKGDTASVKAMVEKAEKAKISFVLETEKGKTALATIQRERAEREAAEKAERDRQVAAKEAEKKRVEAEKLAERERKAAEKLAEERKAAEKLKQDTPIQVTADQLLREYKDNEAKANNNYKGKNVQVTGTIKRITDKWVELKGNEQFEFLTVDCFLDREVMASLSSGSDITVIGKCDGKGFGGINIRKCVLIK